jgi:hypothetical protein
LPYTSEAELEVIQKASLLGWGNGITIPNGTPTFLLPVESCPEISI